MGILNYNSNDEEYVHLTKLLRSLPKVKADDDFEYKLMVKIQNGNFDIRSEEKHFSYSKTLIPVAAVAFSVVLVFFIFSDSSVNLENPLLRAPQARQAYAHGQVDTIEITPSRVLNNEHAVALQAGAGEANEAQANNEQVMKVVVQPNDVVSTVNRDPYPFDQARSLDLDSYVTGEQQAASPQQGGMLVGGVQESNSPFEGFLIRQRPNKEVMAAYKAMLDSLKKSQQENR